MTEQKCVNNAPFIAYPAQGSTKTYHVSQGCCNDWTCPRCGIMRAKHEYGRIVEGCRTLAKEHQLYFLTLTCRGKELSLDDSENHYLEWTNRLLTALRTNATRREIHWCYVQVTERQKRGHPHSHLITTYYPADLENDFKVTWTQITGKLTPVLKPALRSEYLRERMVSAGLGEQYDISEVKSAEGVSRYVAKYLFKDTIFETTWRKNWKRVRYSQSFPKLPERKNPDAFVLLSLQDWSYFRAVATIAMPNDMIAHEAIVQNCTGSDILIRKPIVSVG